MFPTIPVLFTSSNLGARLVNEQSAIITGLNSQRWFTSHLLFAGSGLVRPGSAASGKASEADQTTLKLLAKAHAPSTFSPSCIFPGSESSAMTLLVGSRTRSLPHCHFAGRRALAIAFAFACAMPAAKFPRVVQCAARPCRLPSCRPYTCAWPRSCRLTVAGGARRASAAPARGHCALAVGLRKSFSGIRAGRTRRAHDVARNPVGAVGRDGALDEVWSRVGGHLHAPTVSTPALTYLGRT